MIMETNTEGINIYIAITGSQKCDTLLSVDITQLCFFLSLIFHKTPSPQQQPEQPGERPQALIYLHINNSLIGTATDCSQWTSLNFSF